MVGVAVNPTLVPAQTAPEGLLEMLTDTGNVAFTTWVMLFEVAGDPLAQPALELSWQVIKSLLTGTKLKLFKLLPTLIPLTFHWNVGVVPPLVGVAVNPTLVPAQTAPEGLLEMLTDTGNVAFTTWVMLFEVAGDPLAQVAFETTVQDIRSLLLGV